MHGRNQRLGRAASDTSSATYTEDRYVWGRNDQPGEEDGGDILQGGFHKREASMGGAFCREQINWRWDLRVRIVAAGSRSDG